MKIGIISDIHAEFLSASELLWLSGLIRERLAEADLILAAGDIAWGTDGLEIMRTLFGAMPVYLVAGNHEFYKHDYQEVLNALRYSATGNLHFLHLGAAETQISEQRVRVLGTTLWTDFDLYGNPDLALLWAGNAINDFRLIQYGERTLRPRDTLKWHQEQRQWLFDQLEQPFDGITIVMTHHAPVSFAIAPRYTNDRLSPCFASRMEEMLIQADVPLVVWGHTHYCVDRTIDRTRFVSNQTGYLTGTGTETGEFGKIVELV